MGPKSRINWLRYLLLAGLCLSLVLQSFMVQATGIEVVAADEPVLCHNVSDDSSADDNNKTALCHLCWLPGASTLLLSDAPPAISVPTVVVAPRYSLYIARFFVVMPPPRGSSRAPPSFA